MTDLLAGKVSRLAGYYCSNVLPEASRLSSRVGGGGANSASTRACALERRGVGAVAVLPPEGAPALASRPAAAAAAWLINNSRRHLTGLERSGGKGE